MFGKRLFLLLFLFADLDEVRGFRIEVWQRHRGVFFLFCFVLTIRFSMVFFIIIICVNFSECWSEHTQGQLELNANAEALRFIRVS